MKCSELQFDLSLYRDGGLDEIKDAAVRSHIDICPLCRQRASEFNEIGAALRKLSAPEMPSHLKGRLSTAVANERLAGTPVLPAGDLREWLTMRLMPYCVGLAASVFIGFSFLTTMYTGNGGVFEANEAITPTQFAYTRLGYGPESPSINPRGTLVELTESLVTGGMADDEMVVVADVYENGLAEIAEIVEPSHDLAAVSKLQKALQTDPSFAPFIPTNIEARPQTVRVVFKLQSVSVHTREPGLADNTSSL